MSAISGHSPRMTSAARKPSSVKVGGMRTSRTTRSGRCSATTRITDSPSATLAQARPLIAQATPLAAQVRAAAPALSRSLVALRPALTDGQGIVSRAGALAGSALPTLAQLRSVLEPLAAHYFLRARNPKGRVIDSVARFHLGNGARLERIDWLGDLSAKGMRESAGIMVNYIYRLDDIEENHEAFANNGEVVASSAVKRLLKGERRLLDSMRLG